MTETLTPPTATAVLLVALEPAVPRARIEAALVLLGQRADALGEATERGLVRAAGDRLEVLDNRVARVVTQTATERERRLAHLALACSRARRTIGYDARSVFDALSGALDGTVPLPPAERVGDRGPSVGPPTHATRAARWPSSPRADFPRARSRRRRS